MRVEPGLRAEEGLDAAYAGRKVLVLGASGFIGAWVAVRLARLGCELWVTARSREELDRARSLLGFEGIALELDAAAPGALEAAIASVAPDLVFNLIGYGVDRAERDEAVAAAVNDELVGRLISALPGRRTEWRGQSLIHVGSALEYGEAAGDLREETEPEATTVYGRTKLAGTRRLARAAEAGLRATTARLFTVYGPGEHPGRLLPSLLEARRGAGRIALSHGLQRRDFTYVDDVAQGLVRLAASEAVLPPVLNLATGRLRTVRHFVEVAARELGIDAGRLGFGEIEVRREEMAHDDVNLDRLRSALGWVPSTPIAEGVRRTAELVGG
ncbi:MAG: NAD-dependent epimerase/dehydratase family protein [Gemmatimonadales bacterium]